MTYEELKKAYENAMQKCSELEKEIAEKDKEIENKDLRIEHLTELMLKRNKMLLGREAKRESISVTDRCCWTAVLSTKPKQNQILLQRRQP
jgi:chromosome segregation ATPase